MAFLFFFYQFPSEYVLIEIVLKLLIGDVNAQLLETVHVKILKSKYVQNANRATLRTTPKIQSIQSRLQLLLPASYSGMKKTINVGNNPTEKPAIESLGWSVSKHFSLFRRIKASDRLPYKIKIPKARY